MNDLIQDAVVREVALREIEKLSAAWNWTVPWSEIGKGFFANGRKYCYASTANGIFKPHGMQAALSIKTSVPKPGHRKWYRDQLMGVLPLDQDSTLLNYDLEIGRNAYRNQYLKRAIRECLPLIYFHGIVPALYQPIAPVWGASYNEKDGYISLTTTPPSETDAAYSHLPQTSYSWRQHKARNHQSQFSSRVRTAYRWRCAFSGLPVRELLVGAHIIPDSEGGPPTVNNGISMSTLHHTAFDNNLIGIDPMFEVHVSPVLRDRDDGKVLDALKNLEGNKILLPRELVDRPSKEFLEQRFETFRSSF